MVTPFSHENIRNSLTNIVRRQDICINDRRDDRESRRLPVTVPMPVLSYLNRPSRGLLSTVNGRSRAEHDKVLRSHIEDLAKPDQENSPSTSTTHIRSWRETHPPANNSELKRDMSESDPSDDEGPSRGHIQPSNFKKKDGKTRKQSPTEGEIRDAARTKKRRTDSEKDGFDDLFPDLKPKVTRTYGSNNASKVPNAKPSFMRGRAEVSKTFSRKTDSGPDAKSRKSKGIIDPLYPSFPGLIKLADKFENPRNLIFSPTSSDKRKNTGRLEMPDEDDDISDPKPDDTFVTYGTPRKDKNGRISQTLDFPSSPELEKPQAKKRGKKKKKESTPPPKEDFIDFNEEMELPPEFNHELDDDHLDNVKITDTQAASGFVDPTTLLPDEDDEDDPDADLRNAVKETLCPWCSKPVSEEALRTFSKGNRMGVRQQQRFCHSHNKKSAQELYTSKSYPTIYWDELPSRIESHAPSLLPIINNTASSFYRSRLAEKVASGADRAMKSEENLNPGYYGPRGYNMMCEILVQKWGKLLKEKAVKDRVISGRGSAYFIQTVLVAELASRLVSEDMGISLEEARGVLEESKDIGEMLHEEEG